MSVIQIENVAKSYQLGDVVVDALTNINLSYDKPGINALMGPSGSGKSTLLNLIGALDSPSKGRVMIDNTDISTLNLDERARFRNSTCGFIFQNFNLIPVLTTIENVLLPTYFAPQKDAQRSLKKAQELLARVGLEDQAQQSVNKLSGGQMQRVAIARSLINDPKIIMADEPTANLDHDTADKILKLLRDLCINDNKIVIMATHDHTVLPFCNRVTHLRDGKFLKEEIYN